MGMPLLGWIVLILPLLDLVASSNNTQPLPVSELYSLRTFFYSLNGDNWVWMTPTSIYGNRWNFSNDNISLISPCMDSWQGVTCDCTSGSYCNIVQLSLERYGLDGVLSDMNNFTMLSALDFGYNTLLRGDLLTMSKLTMLESIYLSYTSISGDLWPISNLMKLQIIFLDKAYITGDLWPVSNLTNLLDLSIHDTYISGTLWAIRNLTKLEVISLSHTYVTGDLTPISNLTMLRYLSFHDTPTISGDLSTVSNFKVLQGLILSNTSISGDLTALRDLTMLQDLSLHDTNISGDLWPISNLTKLEVLYLYDTYICGDLVPVSNLTMLQDLALGGTSIRGNLAPLRNLTQLSTLALSNTNIVADLAPLSSLLNLAFCLLSDNSLYGPIPSMRYHVVLKYFNVDNNHLTGTLPDDFPDSLQVLNIANNMLTGMLPNSLFSLPQLLGLDASINCMKLTFTQEVCNSTSLQYVVLDGLHSAKTCRSKLPIKIYNTIYKERDSVIENVPSCIYNLVQLQYLHLSDNGITGTLPDYVILASSFTELVLANNELRSSIPAVFQNHKWSKLDLSFNKFSGGLSTSMMVSDSVKLKSNRLSGDIPESLYNTSDVNILTGNMFTCDSRQLSLLHDEVSENYICGSSSFNDVSYLWLSVVLLCLLLFASTKFFDSIRVKKEHVVSMLQIKTAIASGRLDILNIDRFTDTIAYVRRTSSLLAIAAVCVFMPFYAVLSHYCGTYDHQYAWILSAAFLSGLDSGVILFVLYLLTLLLICYYNRKATEEILASRKTDNRTNIVSTRRDIVYSVLFCVNLVLMIAINGFYVFVFLNYDEVVVDFTAIFVSIFVVIWTNYALLATMVQLEKCCIKAPTGPFDHLHLLSIVSIINYVVIPCLASALFDPSCFYNVIVSPNDVSSTVDELYSGPSTVVNGITFTTPVDTSSTATYTPSFAYSYQCSSAILTSYAIVFMYSALLSSLLSPFIYYFRTNSSVQQSCLGRLVPTLFRTEIVIDQAAITHFLLSLVGSISIFVTFGVVAPILGFVMFLSIVAQTFYMEYRLGVYVASVSTDNGQERIKNLKSLDADLEKIESTLLQSTWQILLFLGPFFGFFVFDIMGDKFGYHQALWAPITFIFICLVLYLIPYHAPSLCGDGSTTANDITSSDSRSKTTFTTSPIHN